VSAFLGGAVKLYILHHAAETEGPRRVDVDRTRPARRAPPVGSGPPAPAVRHPAGWANWHSDADTPSAALPTWVTVRRTNRSAFARRARCTV